jgi:anthranilate/para-aminobenzoate synthase component I
VVAASDPLAELQETQNKLAALRQALLQAETMEHYAAHSRVR